MNAACQINIGQEVIFAPSFVTRRSRSSWLVSTRNIACGVVYDFLAWDNKQVYSRTDDLLDPQLGSSIRGVPILLRCISYTSVTVT